MLTKGKPLTTSSKIAKNSAWRDRLSTEDIEELKTVFDLFDEDGSGTIDSTEIQKTLEELGVLERNPLVYGMIKEMANKNKPISFQIFLDVVCGRVGDLRTRDGLRRLFSLYDSDGEGLIRFDKIKQILRLIGDGMNDDALLEMLHTLKVTNSAFVEGQITFEQFYAIMRKHN